MTLLFTGHRLPQAKPLKAIKKNCHKTLQQASEYNVAVLLIPPFAPPRSQNLRTNVVTVALSEKRPLPQVAVVLVVPYRPSPPTTDSSYLAHTDLKEELSNQDICTFICDHCREKSLPDIKHTHAQFYSSSCSGGLRLAFCSALNLPQNNAFPSNEMNTRYDLKNIHPFPSKTSLQHSKPLTGQQAECFPWVTSPPSPLLMTSPVISMQHASPINPCCSPNRGGVRHAEMMAQETEDHSCIQKVIIKAHQELQFISGSEMQHNIFTAGVCDAQQ